MRARMAEGGCWWRATVGGGLVAMLFLAGGCGRGSDTESTDGSGEPPAEPPAVVQAADAPAAAASLPSAKAPERPVKDAGKVRVLGDEDSEISVRMISNIPERGLRVVVVNKKTGASAMLSPGHEFAGYRLVGCEEGSDKAVFLRNGENVGIPLRVVRPEGPPPVTGPGGAEIREQGAVSEPTPEMIAKRDAWLKEMRSKRKTPGTPAGTPARVETGEAVPPGGP
jgi:hypothetical protein